MTGTFPAKKFHASNPSPSVMGSTCGFPTSLCMSEGHASHFWTEKCQIGRCMSSSHLFLKANTQAEIWDFQALTPR